MDKVEHSWEWRAPRDDRNKFRSTLRWKRAPHATRQVQTGVNVSENCYSTFNAQPSTFNLQRSTFNAQPSTFNLQRPTFNLTTLNLQRATCNVQRSPLTSTPAHNAQRSNVQRSNVQRSTFQPSTPNLQPSTPNLQPSPPRLTVISRSRRARAAPLSRLWRAWCSPSRRSAARSAATRAAAAFNSATSRRAL